jgi:hypothetical protein
MKLAAPATGSASALDNRFELWLLSLMTSYTSACANTTRPARLGKTNLTQSYRHTTDNGKEQDARLASAQEDCAAYAGLRSLHAVRVNVADVVARAVYYTNLI